MKKWGGAPSGPLLAVLSLASNALASDASDLEGLLDQSIVTTASKSAEMSSTAPATTSTMTAEDLRRYGIHSLAEAINFLSLGAITFDPLHTVDIGARGIFIKGDNGDHFLLLIDGHAVNEQLSGSARFDRGLGVPMELIDHVEVILGPGSVLYGSNAMLGVINVVTKRAKDFSGVHLKGETEIGKSYEISGGAGTTFDLFHRPTDVTIALQYYKHDGPDFFFEPQYFGINDQYSGEPFRTRRNGPPSGVWGGDYSHVYRSEVPAAQLRIVHGAFELNVHAKTFKRAAPYASDLVNHNGDFDDPGTYALDRSLWIDLRHRATLSRILELSTRIYGDTFDQQAVVNVSRKLNCRYARTLTCVDREGNLAQWAGAEVQGNLDWVGSGTFVTLLGVDGRLRFVGAKRDELDFDTGQHLRSSDGVIRERDGTLGVYAQQTWQPFKILSFNGGLRYDFDPRFSPVPSPRVAATVSPWQGGTLKAVYAEAFRAPSWYETSVNSFDILHSERLNPERVRSIEGSIEQRFGTQRIAMGAFRTEWRNMVELHILTEAEMLAAGAQDKLDLVRQLIAGQYRNVASIDNYGFNGTYEGSLYEGSLRYGVNLTGAIARRSDDQHGTTLLEVAPRLFGNARILYDLPGDWPAIGIAAQFKTKALTDRALDGLWSPLPMAPAQLELRLTVSGPVPAARGFWYRASADYAFADRTPYTVGVHQSSGIGQRYYPYLPEFDNWYLAPVDTFRATLGLGYDLSL
jgi:outer membrane receptor for ferrienterochelin and colicins